MAREHLDLTTVELLFGHTSEETALRVEDYPYGRRVRTSIRYWLETTKHGDRFVSQTLNPKTGRWNKPKKSTYSNLAVMYRAVDPEDGILKTRYAGLSDWPSEEWLAHFCAEVGSERLSEAQREKLAAVIGRTRAMKNVTFEVVETGSMTEQERELRDAEQALANRQVNKLIAIETHRAGQALAEREE